MTKHIFPKTGNCKDEHLPISLFQVGKTSKGNIRWKCSWCEKIGVWGKSWRYYGYIECPYCWKTDVKFVACSKSCRQHLMKKYRKRGYTCKEIDT